VPPRATASYEPFRTLLSAWSSPGAEIECGGIRRPSRYRRMVSAGNSPAFVDRQLKE
jgi:hypothetical protein